MNVWPTSWPRSAGSGATSRTTGRAWHRRTAAKRGASLDRDYRRSGTRRRDKVRAAHPEVPWRVISGMRNRVSREAEAAIRAGLDGLDDGGRRGRGSGRARRRSRAGQRFRGESKDRRGGAAAVRRARCRQDGPAGRGGRCGLAERHTGAARCRGGVRGRSELFRAVRVAASRVRRVRPAERRAPGCTERGPRFQ